MAYQNATSPDKEFLNGEDPLENGNHTNKIAIQVSESDVEKLQNELYEEAREFHKLHSGFKYKSFYQLDDDVNILLYICCRCI